MRLIAVFLVFSAACTAAPETTTTDLRTTTTPDVPRSTAPAPSSTIATTSTTVVGVEVSWSEVEAERMVENHLAALAAGAWEVAGFAAFNNGVVIPDADPDELPAETFARLCADGACNGPYQVRALGPGRIDPVTFQASSTVEVTHLDSGDVGEIEVFTFEGQRIITDLPPLRPSPEAESLIQRLFGEGQPARAVVARNDGFESWSDGRSSWHLNWWAKNSVAMEGDWVLASDPFTGRQQAVTLDTPTAVVEVDCSGLIEREGRVLALNRCVDGWALLDLESQTPVPLGFDVPDVEAEGGYLWVEERAGARFEGVGDAEGNLVSIQTGVGLDILGDRYAGLTRIASDGSFLVLVDHRDPAAYSHFYSPVVVALDFATGSEIGRWVLDGPVLCLEADDRWVVACVGDSLFSEPAQFILVAIDVRTGQVNSVESRSRIFLPG